MPGLIIGGKEVEVPGVTVRNYKDEPKLAIRVGRSDGANDGETPRKYPVSLIVLHTTKGVPGGSDKRPQVLHPGLGDTTHAPDRTVEYWSTDPTPSAAHIVVDQDGVVGCLADLKEVCAYHAGDHGVNHRSVGIEIYQGNDAGLYEGQLDAVVKLVDVLTIQFGVQRQIPTKYLNKPAPRLDAGGADCVGVVGHRDVSNNRGFGDPGDFIFEKLEKVGYERVDFYQSQDLELWKTRQKDLATKSGVQLVADGIPGPATRAALLHLGYEHGLWALAPAQTPASPLENVLNGFLPAWSQMAGSKEAALDIISAWLERQG